MTPWLPHHNKPHYVYKAFDSYGLLLYIGCSYRPSTRLAQHRSRAPWFRFAETVGVWGPFDDREIGYAVEARAIASEGSYFNATVADMVRTNANRVAAQQRVCARGIECPPVEDHYLDDEVYAAEHDAAYETWDRYVEREKARLKTTTHPFMTDADRLARYLAAREDAELARLEAAA